MNCDAIYEKVEREFEMTAPIEVVVQDAVTKTSSVTDTNDKGNAPNFESLTAINMSSPFTGNKSCDQLRGGCPEGATIEKKQIDYEN